MGGIEIALMLPGGICVALHSAHGPHRSSPMETQHSTPEQHRAADSHANEEISIQARIVLWLFVVVFIGFALLLIGDLVSSLWR